MDDNKEQKAEQASVVETVTRPKHPGRVAQGKKLAALMKERKDALLKNRDSEVTKEVNSEQSSHSWKYSGLGIILLICVGGFYFFTRKASTTPLPPEPVKQEVKKWME